MAGNFDPNSFNPSAKLNPHIIAAQGSGFYSSQPVILTIKVLVTLASIFLTIQVFRWRRQAKSAPNPFAQPDTEPRKPYEMDQKKRDAVLKQPFKESAIPKKIDAIIIGSGIGGMTTAAIMAKSGKKVLVLEQHDQAGGACHTFKEKGYEFDVGIHYIGDLGHLSMSKVLLDNISAGQIEWAPMEKAFDVVRIGDEAVYPVIHNTEKETYKDLLHKQFPDETEAINKYFELLKKCKPTGTYMMLLKIIPLWLAKFLTKTGIFKLATGLWSGELKKTTAEISKGLTKNKHLQTVFSYCWGDYGTPPTEAHFMMQALLHGHYVNKGGGFYPVGGASEIAFNIIPIIERTGGAVLVRATVTEILTDGKKVTGVSVRKSGAKNSEEIKIEAPIVVSDAGVVNTFQNLLPKQIAEKCEYSKLIGDVKPGISSISVFVGLNASAEELGLKANNVWYFSSDDNQDNKFNQYKSLDVESMLNAELPLLFMSFPSTKDPRWAEEPERRNKSTCALITLADWKWYEQYQDEPHKRRGDNYDEIKAAIGDKMLETACKFYPQLRHHVEYMEVGTPLTNKYYLRAEYGSVYGLDHGWARLDPWNLARLRPETDIDGLFMTGQDIFTAGFSGALYAGALTAGSALGRNVLNDVIGLYSRLKKEEKAAKKKM